MGRTARWIRGAAAVGLALLVAWPLAAEGGGRPKVSGWRGDGTGLYPEADPPSEWDIDDGTNILWQVVVGKGPSTPVIAGGRIFVTAEPSLLLCIERRSGKVLWKRNNGYDALPPGTKRPAKRPPTSPGCGYSAATPVTDGELVYASYGTGIVVCYDRDGDRKWLRYFDDKQLTEYGRSASPRLAAGKLLVSMAGLRALDPRTGATLWHAKEAKPTYGTPAITRVGDVDVAVTPNGDCVRLADGSILASEMACTTYASPLVHGDIVYFVGAPTRAMKLSSDAAGVIRPERLWENDDVEGGFFASPVCHEGVLYCVSNEGVFYALDATTGETAFQKQLEIPSMAGTPGIEPGNLYASLTLAGQRLLLTNDVGDTLVLAPRRQDQEISHNRLDKGSGASPVPDGTMLFLRGGDKLYCIGAK